jgi:hypothetical protein
LFGCVGRGVLKNMFSIFGEEAVKTGINPGKEVVIVSG